MILDQPDTEIATEDPEAKWYAIYTKSRHEKKTAELLNENNITAFLPLVKTLKQWSDRKKYVHIPLFNAYIFVHINIKDKYKVLETQGVVCFIRIGTEPVPIPENQINAIKEYILSESDKNTNYNLNPGQRIQVSRGPMKGLQGVITKVNNRQKIKVSIEAINQVLHLSVPASLVEPVYG